MAAHWQTRGCLRSGRCHSRYEVGQRARRLNGGTKILTFMRERGHLLYDIVEDDHIRQDFSLITESPSRRSLSEIQKVRRTPKVGPDRNGEW